MNTKKIRYKEKASMPSPYKLLWIFAVIVPALNTLILGSISLTLDYFSKYYGAFTVGTVLLLLYEIVSTIFSAVKYASVLSALMILGFVSVKKGFVSTIGGILLAFLGQLINILFAVLSFSLLYMLGVSDSTGSLPAQLQPLVGSSVVESLLFLLFLAVSVLIFALVKKKTKHNHPFATVKTPYMVTVYSLILVYTLFLLASPVSMMIKAGGKDILRDYIIPLLYPFLYSAALYLWSFYFARKLEVYFEE